jgi:hypothetical protein
MVDRTDKEAAREKALRPSRRSAERWHQSLSHLACPNQQEESMEHITQVLEPIAAEIHEAELEREAAGVRKAITESLMFDVRHGAHDPDIRHDLIEAIVLCRHLTAARVPDA